MTEQARRVLRRVLVGMSLLLNITFACVIAVDKLNAPRDRVGVLTRDLEIGSFSGTKTLFRLPKGLTVRDASPQFLAAIGQFEPYRCSIVITSEDEALVDYHVARASLHQHQEYYSAELDERRAIAREPKIDRHTEGRAP